MKHRVYQGNGSSSDTQNCNRKLQADWL